MSENSPDIRCPLAYANDVFGGKWKPRIICVLHVKGVLRYHELRDELCNISNKVLSSSLKELVNDGMVSRIESDSQPLKVEYALTPRGESVVPILKSICEWSNRVTVDPGCGIVHLCTGCSYEG